MNFQFFTQIQRDVQYVYKNKHCSKYLNIIVIISFKITMIFLAAATSAKHAAQRNVTTVI